MRQNSKLATAGEGPVIATDQAWVTFSSWVSEMEHANREKKKVYRLNLPTREANRLIRRKNAPLRRGNAEIEEKNRKRKELKLPPLPLHRLNPLIKTPHTVTARTRRILDREANVMIRLREKPPELWEADVKSIDDPILRGRAACLIWWDFFSLRTFADRWSHLDRFIARPYAFADADSIAITLWECGYTPWMAKRRTLSAASGA